MHKNLFFLLSVLFFCHCTISCKVFGPGKITESWNPGDKLLSIEYHDRWGFINQKGQVVIAPKFRNVGVFSEDLCPVRLHGTYGFINPKGEFVIPAIYDYALPFSEGLARVYINGKVLFIDKEGKKPWSIDVKDASDFNLDIAEVTFQYGDSTWTGVLNKAGKVQIPETSELVTSSEGLRIATREYKNNTTGKIVRVNKEIQEALPFENGRAFVGEIKDWVLIDRSGKQLSNNHFVWFKEKNFSQNLVLVAAYPITRMEKNEPAGSITKQIHKMLSPLRSNFQFTSKEKWGAIDSMGEYVITPQFDKVLEPGFQQEGLLVALADSVLRKKHRDPYTGQSYTWGLIDQKGNYLFKPKLTKVSESGFQNGLLYAEIDSLYGYVDINGKFVWSAIRSTKTTKFNPLNSAFMLPGYLSAFPRGYKWGMNNNGDTAQAIPNVLSFPKDTFGIHVFSGNVDTFQKKWKGKRAVVFNTSKDTLIVDVQDSRLYIVMQAKDSTCREWRDIEYLSNSWCGRSYHTIPLGPNEYWNLVIPEYEGDIQTELRLAFNWRSQRQDNGAILTKTVYSNTFSGSINPGQFWNKSGF